MKKCDFECESSSQIKIMQGDARYLDLEDVRYLGEGDEKKKQKADSEDSKPGRKEKADDEKSEKTIANQESMN